MNPMNKGPIIYIEDDEDDQFLFQATITSLNISNELLLFNHGQAFLDYLYVTKDKPLIIFCDINMPVMNGITLRKTIMKDDFLRKKSIPFVFYTTGVSSDTVNLAYELTVQGFFQKANNIIEINALIKLVIEYWCSCKHPNNG